MSIWLKVMLAMALIIFVLAQPPTNPPSHQQQPGVSSLPPTDSAPTPTSNESTPTSTTTTTTPTTTTATATTTITTATTETNALETPGPAVNTYPPGTDNCLDPYCAEDNDCFVFSDGLVCLKTAMNWGYVLSRNSSGIPSVPGWSGPRSQLNANCTLFQMPRSDDKPGLALRVYDLIHDTIPKDLLLSRYDQATTNWYTLFSNCEPHLACLKGKCQPRPTLGQSCTSSWQCNALALGLNENNAPIPSSNVSGTRCEYDGGDKSVNTTCQLIKRETNEGGSGFLIWHVLVPLAVVAIIGYFGWIIYRRYKNEQKHGKWKRVAEDQKIKQTCAEAVCHPEVETNVLSV
ncbi:hypothetical protein BG015_003430 [Linnemannia schmuckeri]|uniref:Uncharacterized protein n=1 Tax=Linnemannia schmuckeri TaxID=64567 RepID=A0A9P5V3Z7_9FUNG|nr:hypothetical protein BG015_003430 [Linnemannia schmuckeri]